LKPLLKWVGGKSQLLAAITERIPKEFGRYHEPFLGGGALYFHLESAGASVADFNPRLIDFYSHVRDFPEELFTEITSVKSQFDLLAFDEQAAKFYELRNEFNNDRQPSVRSAALFLFLNKAGFNGLFRENREGFFNVPFGQKKSLSIPDLPQFFETASLLRTAEITSGSYESVFERANEGDFVYFDPPYVPLEGSPSFTSYLSSGFGPQEQKQLAQMFRDLAERGVFVMASNSYTEPVRELYSDFNVQIVNARRNINSIGSKRGAVEEALITSY
jgi:DNA adenine methylase